MHLLFLVPYTPTLIRTRSYNLVRGLARRGNHVTLATLWENDQERAALMQLEREGICAISARLTRTRALWNVCRALPSDAPLQFAYCWQPKLMQLIHSKFQVPGSRFDIVHVEHLRGARYGLRLKSETCDLRPEIPISWDSVDCISYLFEQAAHRSRSPFGRFVTRLELARTRKCEAYLIGQFNRVLVTSPVDKAALDSLSAVGHRESAVEVLPNGVDLGYFTPGTVPRDPDTIVFSGKLSYHANVTAALYLINDVMPLVWKEHPNVRVNIVGRNPPRALTTLHHALVTVTGAVPDLRPYLQRAAVAVAPIPYGAGIQNKVLEAMACATPVVATPQAVSALRATEGEHLLIGDGAEPFARQVLRLLDDAALRERIGKRGRKFVEENHDWNQIVEHLENIYRRQLEKTCEHPRLRAF